MFGFLPSWAVGVIAIMAGIGVLQILIAAAYKAMGIPRREWGGRTKGRTVIGVNLPSSDSGEHAAVLDDLQRRIAELEERVDFAERLLAQHRDAAQLNPPNR